MQKKVFLVLVLIAIVVAIYFLSATKQTPSSVDVVEVVSPSTGMDLKKKQKMFPLAKEITTPDAFINIDEITIDEHIGKNIILIDFWTYSCINCIRTLPFLNAWHEKYADQGLVIIGVHTPEFEFEKNISNVSAAVKKHGIEYPVVLDNDFSTWTAYRNRYWPRKYLIDIDGFVVYDHVGEGGYDVTEAKIQELLEERAQRLGLTIAFDASMVDPEAEVSKARTPEIYFGSARNDALGNGKPSKEGLQTFTEPDEVKPKTLYLVGEWDISEEFAQSKTKNAKIIIYYESQNVFVVASCEKSNTVSFRIDGNPPGSLAGSDASDGVVNIQADGLYRFIEDPSGRGKHLLEITIPEPGLKVFTFTFG